MDHETKLYEIFFPYAHEKQLAAKANNTRFVHYSSADAAMKMITNREVWMRKASCMNDFSEIDYGSLCLRAALRSAEGNRLVEVLERLFPGLCREVAQIFDHWLPWRLENTYLTCFSEHRSPDEDVLGRLSMWRAYGGGTGVAVVTTATPFLTESHALRAYTSPVGYFTEAQFRQRLADVVSRIEANEPFLQGIDREEVKIRLFNMYLYAATCTKHPGFKEELEWRIIHHPDLYPSPHLTKSIETIRGVPQLVFKIHLRNIPAEIPIERLDGIEIPELVERVIIGPTQHPTVIREAFIMELSAAGVRDAARRVVISDIPLRQ
jgi:Protein of unknown function (DUF2971)